MVTVRKYTEEVVVITICNNNSFRLGSFYFLTVYASVELGILKQSTEMRSQTHTALPVEPLFKLKNMLEASGLGMVSCPQRQVEEVGYAESYAIESRVGNIAV
jgi:hypothetical protein